MNISAVKMDFRYGGSFGAHSPDAYERLLHDAIVGDPHLVQFAATKPSGPGPSWTPHLAGGRSAPPPFPYESGTWGPPEAEAFIAQDGREWRRP